MILPGGATRSLHHAMERARSVNHAMECSHSVNHGRERVAPSHIQCGAMTMSYKRRAQIFSGVPGQVKIVGQGHAEICCDVALITVIGGHGGVITLDLPVPRAAGTLIRVEKKNDRQAPAIALGRNGDTAFEWPQRHQRITLVWSATNARWERGNG